MKGSPILATAVVGLVLLVLYGVTYKWLLAESQPAASSQQVAHDHGHDHGEHDHGEHDHGEHGHDHGEHDNQDAANEEEHHDESVLTVVELVCSAEPVRVILRNPVDDAEVAVYSSFEGGRADGEVRVDLTGHYLDLLVEVEWREAETTVERFVEVTLIPEAHAARTMTVRSDAEEFAELATFSW